jgi:hypothetical protein
MYSKPNRSVSIKLWQLHRQKQTNQQIKERTEPVGWMESHVFSKENGCAYNIFIGYAGTDEKRLQESVNAISTHPFHWHQMNSFNCCIHAEKHVQNISSVLNASTSQLP